jgi:hypothetical protein
MRLVVTEYPKSGGTWVVSMLGDALNLPKRDVYVKTGFQAFDISQHPWYVGANGLDLPDGCVIKSHEMPQSREINFPARFVHLVRDGRDVVVSKFFFDSEFSVANGLQSSFEPDFDAYLRRVTGEWRDYVQSWQAVLPAYYRYEDFLEKPGEMVRRVTSDVGLSVSEQRCCEAVEANTREKMHQALNQTFRHNTFVRKGVSGDWRNYFSSENIVIFKKLAGQLLVDLGYEHNLNW